MVNLGFFSQIILGICFSDLMFINEANSDRIRGEINIFKLKITYRTITELLSFQKTEEYIKEKLGIIENKELQNLLLGCITFR